MKNIGWLISWTCLTLAVLAPHGMAAEEPTQRDFLTNLVVGLGLSYGLPDEPDEADYLTVAGSDRTLRVEAEEAYSKTDFVAVKTFANFGRYSGSGWIGGANTPTLLHLDFLLPWSGTYEVRTSLRFAGHTFDFGDRLLIGSGDEEFSEVSLGTVDLEAGPRQVVVELPPNGGIDYLELRGTPQPPLMPFAGWNLDQPVSNAELAEVALIALDLLALLPQADRSRQIEIETSGAVEESLVVRHRHLGPPDGGAWVRAGMTGLEMTIPFTVASTEVLRIAFRGLGEQPVPVGLDGIPLATLEFRPYLSEAASLPVAVTAGPHEISALLPPRAGLDSLTLDFSKSDREAVLSLVGIDPEVPVAVAMNRLIALLAALLPAS